jgi:hypothetical protein
MMARSVAAVHPREPMITTYLAVSSPAVTKMIQKNENLTLPSSMINRR